MRLFDDLVEKLGLKSEYQITYLREDHQISLSSEKPEKIIYDVFKLRESKIFSTTHLAIFKIRIKCSLHILDFIPIAIGSKNLNGTAVNKIVTGMIYLKVDMTDLI